MGNPNTLDAWIEEQRRVLAGLSSHQDRSSEGQLLVLGQEESLRAGEWALRMVEQGLYGNCERCGGAIDPARLRALPTATTCYHCATALSTSNRRRLSIQAIAARPRAPTP